MDFSSKHAKPNCMLRKVAKPGSKLRWKLLRVSTDVNEASVPCEATAVRATIRKYIRREQKRAELVKLARVLRDEPKKSRKMTVYEERPAAAYTSGLPPPPGAMAPENTTQYLMSNVYEDLEMNVNQAAPASPETSAHLYREHMSPRSVYTALDSGYESCLAFQQRDFEEMFGLC